MAQRNGITPSSIPFERRYRPPAKRRREHLTATDRLVCAACGAFLGLAIWTFAYLIFMMLSLKVAAKAGQQALIAAASDPPVAVRPLDPDDLLPPFSWGGAVAAGFALFGAERMMDAFEKTVRVEGEIAGHINRAR
jgi:hypothetical protein